MRSRLFVNVLFAVLLASCVNMGQEPCGEDIMAPTLTVAEPADSEGSLEVVFGASLSGGITDEDCGFYLAPDEKFAGAEKLKASNTNKSGKFTYSRMFHNYGGKWYCKAYASNGHVEITSPVVSYTVKPFSAYVRTTTPEVLSKIGGDAVLKFSVTAAKGVALSECGVCYGTDRGGLSVESDHISTDGSEGSHTVTIKGLKAGQEYFVCSYAREGDNIVYGDEVSFATSVYVTGVSLNRTSLNLTKGYAYTLSATVLPADASDKSISWSSNNPSVATVDAIGKVTALKTGSATITVKTTDGGYTATCQVTVVSAGPAVPEAVDLGLPSGLKWASFNLGASKPEEYGGHYQWAGLEDVTSTSIYLDSSNCPYHTGSSSLTGWTKYVPSGKSSYWSGSGSPDNKTVLDPEDDVAHVKLDGKWRMPTYAEWEELMNNCTWTRTSQNGIQGYRVTSKKSGYTSKSIFLPGAGYRYRDRLEGVGPYGRYWSSSLSTDYPRYAYVLYFNTADVGTSGSDYRFYGQSVRPVYDDRVSVTGVSLSKTSLSLEVGETSTLSATVTPSSAAEQSVSWSSNNPSVATVDASGNVTALKTGSATITVKTTDGGYTASCSISVIAKTYPVTGVSLNKTSTSIVVGTSETLTATVSPSNASNKNVSWSSYNSSVATVDQSGKVTAKAVGSTTIKVTTSDGGYTATCSVTVTPVHVTGVSLNKTSLNLTEGDTYTLFATVMPADATDKSVIWSSSNPSVAPVDNSGIVIAVKAGSATIAVRTTDGGYTASCSISVIAKTYPVTGVTLDKNEMTLKKGGSYKLTATVSPAGAPEKDKVLEWISSNEEVAKVSADGTVIALQSGNATITTYTRNREFSASCYITVINPITSFKLKTHNGESGVFENETIQIDVAEVMPSDADETEFEWESSDMSAATVDKHGNVTGKVSSSKDCKVIITAKSKTYPDVKATITLDIFAHVKEVHFEPAELTLNSGGGSYSAKTVLKVSPEWAKVQEMESVTPENTDLIVVNKGKTAGEYNVLALPNITGKTRIVAVSKDGAIKGYCNVTVIDKVLVEDIVLNRTSVNLKEGEYVKVTAKAEPSNATNPELKWSSKDEKIASVAQDGIISGIKAGNTEIYVESTDGTKIKRMIPVKVDKAEIKVTDITLSQSSVTLKEGESAKVTATVIPSDATNPTLKWSSKNGTIASVGQDGTINGRSVGNTEIYVESTDGSGIKKTIPVTVNSTEIKVTGITLSQSSVTLKEGEYVKVTARATPLNATNPTLKWSSKNGTVAIVDQDGTIIGRSVGNTEIYVESTDGSGIKKTIPITVEKTQVIHVTSVTLNETSIKIEKGKTFDLVATVNPEDAENKTVTWTVSSGNGIISINPSGTKCTVSGNQNGKAEVTVTSEDGGYKATCSVTVIGPPGGGSAEDVGKIDYNW